jgi:hypothetical protein
VFFFMIFMVSHNKLTSSTQTRSWCVPFNSNLALLSWTFLMAYSKTMVIKHLLVSGHFEWKMHQTNVYLYGFCYRFHFKHI